jgi:hypothetical protein
MELGTGNLKYIGPTYQRPGVTGSLKVILIGHSVEVHIGLVILRRQHERNKRLGHGGAVDCPQSMECSRMHVEIYIEKVERRMWARWSRLN